MRDNDDWSWGSEWYFWKRDDGRERFHRMNEKGSMAFENSLALWRGKWDSRILLMSFRRLERRKNISSSASLKRATNSSSRVQTALYISHQYTAFSEAIPSRRQSGRCLSGRNRFLGLGATAVALHLQIIAFRSEQIVVRIPFAQRSIRGMFIVLCTTPWPFEFLTLVAFAAARIGQKCWFDHGRQAADQLRQHWHGYTDKAASNFGVSKWW